MIFIVSPLLYSNLRNVIKNTEHRVSSPVLPLYLIRVLSATFHSSLAYWWMYWISRSVVFGLCNFGGNSERQVDPRQIQISDPFGTPQWTTRGS